MIITDAWEPQVNGVVRAYQNIAAHLRRQGHDVRVVGPGAFLSFPMPGYKEISLSVLPSFALNRMFRAFDPDAVHIAVEGPLGWAARRWCLRRGKPFTTSFHTHFPDYVIKRLPRFIGDTMRERIRQAAITMVRRFHAPAKATFVATQSLEDQLADWGFDRTKMVRLVHGVDTEIFYPGAKTLFQDRERPILLYVGRIAVEKNIGAFLDLKTKGTKVVVGDGPGRARLQNDYPDVVFAGLRQGMDLADHYRSADLFVFPSKTDTFGMVLTEAAACGLPVAAYDVTGPKDIITLPLLGHVGDNLETAVEQALNAPGTAAERFDHIRGNYAWERIAALFAKTALS